MDDLYSLFLSNVQQMNAEVQFQVNIPCTFFENLYPKIQTALSNHGILPPEELLTNTEQLSRLTTLKNEAAHEEEQWLTVIHLAQSQNQAYHGSKGSNRMMFAQVDDFDTEEIADDNA